jgi:ribosomal peptide maturation radical SAM protein 1
MDPTESLTSIPDVDALLIVPPFALARRATLGVHLLQACASQAGFRVGVWYASLSLAARLGIESYHDVCATPFNLFLGERLFSASAYGRPPLGADHQEFLARHASGARPDDQVDDFWQSHLRFSAPALVELEARCAAWAREAAAALAARGFPIIGCSTMFDQTAASLALLNGVKRLRPDVVTIIGGPNCEGEMAEGIASLSERVDFVFSGESETVFVDFLKRRPGGNGLGARIVRGLPCRDLDALPIPSYREYYEQLRQHFPEGLANLGEMSFPCESSRGCWWGEKHHCTFCGLNGEGMMFRRKSPARLIREIERLSDGSPCRRVQMTDNIMPFDYFASLLPELARWGEGRPPLTIFYEQKANLQLKHVIALQRARITHIQPGIEALSTSLLKRLDKGVTAPQNIALLRYARSVGLTLSWNLLWGIPGDEASEYEETLALLPLLRHLQAPENLAHLSLDRFSPYFERPQLYGIRATALLDGFEAILPPGVDARKVAYHFAGDYDSASRRHPDLIGRIQEEVTAWQKAWSAHVTFANYRVWMPPTLEVVGDPQDGFALLDTRGIDGGPSYATISHQQAAAALVARPGEELDWALAHRVGVMVDGRYVPLATARPELLAAFEAGRDDASTWRVATGGAPPSSAAAPRS